MKPFPYSIILLVCVLASTGSAYTGPDRTRFLEKMAEQANQAEVEFDAVRGDYCQKFGDRLAGQPSAWSAIRTKCLENAVLDLVNVDPNDEFLYVKQENYLMIEEMYVKCAMLADNPCNKGDWGKIKKCLRTLYLTVPEFKANEVETGGGIGLTEEIFQSMNVDKVVFDRLWLVGLLADIGLVKCTRKTLSPKR